MAHVAGWVLPRGRRAAADRRDGRVFRTLGGDVVANHRVISLDDLPRRAPCSCDLVRSRSPISRSAVPASYRHRLERFRYGMGVFKVDWALDGPIPWRARVWRAPTVHLAHP